MIGWSESFCWKLWTEWDFILNGLGGFWSVLAQFHFLLW